MRFKQAWSVSGRASAGLILSVLLAAAVIAVLVYFMTGPSSFRDGARTSEAAPISPLLGEVEMTRQMVDQMNRQQSGLAQAVGVAGAESKDVAWKAEQGCQDIRTALLAFKTGVGSWPVKSAADEDEPVDFLYGVGPLPKFTKDAHASWGARSEALHSYLVSNGPEKTGWTDYFKHIGGRFENWNGPYLPRELADPWGRAYVVSVSGFTGGSKPGNRAWCLSAGPNGVVETPAASDQALGDDVGVQVK
ncbi:MAG: type II secretion system protein GspG [Candidatus Coatesbacteria bacterium]|nr:type II secretion system protein GspG [Candidatus Coatesbacteria bacterium]